MLQPIWLLLDSRQPGGIETHVLQLAEGLHRLEQPVAVIFLADHGPHPLRERLQAQGIPTQSLNGQLKMLLQKIRSEHPEIIHTHGYKAGIYGRIAGKLTRTPVVSTYHSGEQFSGKLALYNWLDRISAVLARQVLAVSPQIARKLPVTATQMDNFIDTRHITVAEGKEIAFVGRLSHEKGADYFLELARLYPEQSFHIYGDGPARESLEQGAPTNICWHGQQQNMSGIWPKIGLLVMPSRHEGLPMAALEAMAHGIPVLASQVGALDQVIDNGCNGWLAAPGDTSALASRLDEWLKADAQKKEAFRQSARSKIEQRFSAQTAMPRLLDIYQSAVAH